MVYVYILLMASFPIVHTFFGHCFSFAATADAVVAIAGDVAMLLGFLSLGLSFVYLFVCLFVSSFI